MNGYKIKIPLILSTFNPLPLFFLVFSLCVVHFVAGYPEESGGGRALILDRINVLLSIVEGRYSSDNKKSDAYIELGDIHASGGKIQEASNYYLSAYYCARSKPRRLTALIRLSDINYYCGSLGKAIEFAKEAVGIAPRDIFLRKKLASYYAAAELWKPAVEEYRKILKIFGDDDREVIFHMAEALERLGLYGEAIDNYKKLLFAQEGRYPAAESRNIKRRLAACYEKMSDFALAEALLKESLVGADDVSISRADSSDGLARDYYEGYMALGWLYYSQGDYKNASGSFSSAIKFASSGPLPGAEGKRNSSARYESLVMSAVSYIKSGRYEEALELLKIVYQDENSIAASSIPDRAAWQSIAHFFSGVAFCKMGNYKSASAEFSKVASNDARDGKKLFISGIAAEFNNYCQSRIKPLTVFERGKTLSQPMLLEPAVP